MWGDSCLPFHILISQLGSARVAFTLPIVGTEHHTVPDLLLFHFRLFWRFLFQSLFVQGKLLRFIVNKKMKSNIVGSGWHPNWLNGISKDRKTGMLEKQKKEIVGSTENHRMVKLRKDEIPGGSHARRALCCCTCKWQMRESNLRWKGFSSLSFCHLVFLLFLAIFFHPIDSR